MRSLPERPRMGSIVSDRLAASPEAPLRQTATSRESMRTQGSGHATPWRFPLASALSLRRVKLILACHGHAEKLAKSRSTFCLLAPMLVPATARTAAFDVVGEARRTHWQEGVLDGIWQDRRGESSASG